MRVRVFNPRPVFAALLLACTCGADGFAQATQSVRDSWPMFRGDPSNSGVAHGILPEKLKLRWKFDTLTARPPASRPAGASSKPSAEPIESTAAIANGVVYFGCDDSRLYAVNLRDGQLKWSFEARGAVKCAPCVAGDAVYFGDEDGRVFAVSAATGERRWEFETKGEIISSPVLSDGKLVIGSYDGTLYALDPANGKPKWKYDTEDRLHGTVGIADGHALIGGCDGKLHVVKLADGTAARKIPIGAPCGASAAIAGAHVFLGTQGNQVLALDWTDGRALWVFEDRERQFPFLSSAAIAEKTVLIGGRDKRLRALQRDTGDVAWTHTARKRIDVSPVIVGNRVFCADDGGDVFALDVATGKELWKYETGSGFIASPAVAEGCLVIGSLDGVLYCFGE